MIQALDSHNVSLGVFSSSIRSLAHWRCCLSPYLQSNRTFSREQDRCPDYVVRSILSDTQKGPISVGGPEDARAIWSVYDLGVKQKCHIAHESRIGPIIRINPYELHINDPNWYDDLYNFEKFDKYEWHVAQFGHPHSSANTVSHELHQKRRGAVGSFFARGTILRLERSVIQRHIKKLCDRLDEFKASKRPLALGTAYRAFTTDVISDYTMAKSFDFLDMPDFNQAWFDAFLENVGMVHTISQFPWFPAAARRLPGFLRHRLLPRTSQFLKFHDVRLCILRLKTKLDV